MNDEIKIDTNVFGEIKSEFIPKWRLIGSHTSRRTFATVNIIKGGSLDSLLFCLPLFPY